MVIAPSITIVRHVHYYVKYIIANLELPSDIGSNDMTAAEYFAEQGRRVNPGNLMQHNNHAYTLAKLGRLAEAEAVFAACRSMIEKESGDKDDLHVYKATAGLIAWRHGDVEGGRRSYGEAVQYFEKTRDKQRLPIALGRWADEERRTGNFTEAAALLARAHVAAESKERTLQHVLLEHLDQSLKKALEPALVATSKQLMIVSSALRGGN